MVVERPVVIEEYSERRARARLLVGVGAVLAGAGAVLVGVAALLCVLWLMAASVEATPFDADGVRCYRAANELACLKTAEPAR